MGGGGMENGIVNLSRTLPQTGFDLHVCCLRSGGAFSERLANPSQVYTLSKSPGLSFECLRKLRNQIRRINPDIIHTHNLGPLIYTFLATRFGKRWKIIHGEHAEITSAELTIRRRLARKFMYKGCRCVHSVSKQLSAQLLELGFNNNEMHTIRNGVDTKIFVPATDKVKAKEELDIASLPSNCFVIGSVGRFGKFKRHSMLVSAFDELASVYKEAVLIIAGDGGPEKIRTLKQISECRHKDRIYWTGFLHDIGRFYRGIDLLVSPSVNEGMSNALLEAMSCGVPVLANMTCGNTEILSGSEGGILAAMDDQADLTHALSSLVSDRKDLAGKGVAARETVSSRFSLSEMTNNYSQLYRRIACQ